MALFSQLSVASQMLQRVAGVSGALAVGLGAYGEHGLKASDPKLAHTYQVGNRFHFFHTIALLLCPLGRRPVVAGALFTAGTFIFSGSCYYIALKEDTRIRPITPVGGTLLILGWLAMAI